jgi:hypothetical protein
MTNRIVEEFLGTFECLLPPLESRNVPQVFEFIPRPGAVRRIYG